MIVLQSHAPDPPDWIGRCLSSVADWARATGLTHRVIDDALFDYLPDDLRRRLADQPVVASDLARLAWMQAELDAGADAVLWLDADTLVAQPSRLLRPDTDHAFGREVWVQTDARGRLRSYVKIHNAAMWFADGNPWLTFYRHAAETILRAHAPGPVVAQIVGPKLLTALHNMVAAPVMETAGVLSPLVIADVLAGDGPALRRFRRDSAVAPAALNLCASSVSSGAVTPADMHRVIDRLLSDPDCLAATTAADR